MQNDNTKCFRDTLRLKQFKKNNALNTNKKNKSPKYLLKKTYMGIKKYYLHQLYLVQFQ
jgi:hypothetical protein